MNRFEFDQLPNVCLKKIFQLLDLRNLAKCRLVCRLFKFYADRAGADGNALVVNEDSKKWNKTTNTDCFKCGNWPLPHRPINYRISINRKVFYFLKLSPLKLDQQLKFLFIDLSEGLDFEMLNWFQGLVYLRIGHYFRRKDRTTSNLLDLPNLQVLKIRESDRFVLKTPKLEVLACVEVGNFQIEHPQTIKWLDCGYEGKNHMAIFKNLEVLDCTYKWGDLNQLSLSDWQHLKELNMIVYRWFGNYSKSHNRLTSWLLKAMNQRTATTKPKLYAEDVLLLDAKQLAADHGILISDNRFKFRNYQLLRRNFCSEVKVNFNELVNLNVGLSSDFFRRFPNIKHVSTTGPVDRDQFEWFLKNATAVLDLTLTSSSLDQAFMANLPKLNSRLTALRVNGDTDLVINFNFILQFERLRIFKTDKQFSSSLDLAAKAIKKLNDLEYFQFRKGVDLVLIHRDLPPIFLYYHRFFPRPTPTKFNLVFLGLKKGRVVGETFRQNDLEWHELAKLYDQTSHKARQFLLYGGRHWPSRSRLNI